MIAYFILLFEIYQSDSQDVPSPRLISGDPLFVNYVLGRSRWILGAACTEKTSCKRGFLISRARSSIGSESGFHNVRCALRIGRYPMPIDRRARICTGETEYRSHLPSARINVANLQHSRPQCSQNAGEMRAIVKRSHICKLRSRSSNLVNFSFLRPRWLIGKLSNVILSPSIHSNNISRACNWNIN